jgi:hypothetical protein
MVPIILAQDMTSTERSEYIDSFRDDAP